MYSIRQNDIVTQMHGNYSTRNYQVLDNSGVQSYDPNGGEISGTVDVSSIPSKNCVVLLYEENTSTYISETTTDNNGVFKFTKLNRSLKFYVIVKNSNPNWEYRVSSRRSPV